MTAPMSPCCDGWGCATCGTDPGANHPNCEGWDLHLCKSCQEERRDARKAALMAQLIDRMWPVVRIAALEEMKG